MPISAGGRSRGSPSVLIFLGGLFRDHLQGSELPADGALEWPIEQAPGVGSQGRCVGKNPGALKQQRVFRSEKASSSDA